MQDSCKEKNVPVRARVLPALLWREQMQALRERKSRITWFFSSLLSLIYFGVLGFLGRFKLTLLSRASGAYIQKAVGHPPPRVVPQHACSHLTNFSHVAQRSEPLGLVMHLAEDIELALLLGGCL